MQPKRFGARRVHLRGQKSSRSLEFGIYHRAVLTPIAIPELCMEGGALSRRRSRRRHYIAYLLQPQEQLPCEGAKFMRADVDISTLTGLSESQIAELHYIGRHGYPLFSASRFFRELGLDPFEAPILEETDAYAVTQLAIWHIHEKKAPEPMAESTEEPVIDPAKISELLAHIFDDAQEVASTKSQRLLQAMQAFCQRIAVSSMLPLERPFLRIVAQGKTRRLRLPSSGLAWGPFAVYGFETVAMKVRVGLARHTRGEQIVNTKGHPVAAVHSGERFFLRLRRKTKRSPVIVARLVRPLGMVPFVWANGKDDCEDTNPDSERPMILVVIGMAREIITLRRLVRLRRNGR